MIKKVEDPRQFNINFPEDDVAVAVAPSKSIELDDEFELAVKDHEEKMIAQTLNREEWETKLSDEALSLAAEEDEHHLGKVREGIKNISAPQLNSEENNSDDNGDNEDSFQKEYYGRFSKFKKLFNKQK